jgi:hypothetical protein
MSSGFLPPTPPESDSLFLSCLADNIHWFQALYYLASFFAQYGPNCTTWLIAAELIPTETRAMAHGWAAAIGEQNPESLNECPRTQHKFFS